MGPVRGTPACLRGGLGRGGRKDGAGGGIESLSPDSLLAGGPGQSRQVPLRAPATEGEEGERKRVDSVAAAAKARSLTHRRRPHLADPRLLGDGPDLVDKGEGVSELLPTRFEDRALGRRQELGHGQPGSPAGRQAGRTRRGNAAAVAAAVRSFGTIPQQPKRRRTPLERIVCLRGSTERGREEKSPWRRRRQPCGKCLQCFSVYGRLCTDSTWGAHPTLFVRGGGGVIWAPTLHPRRRSTHKKHTRSSV